MPKFCDHLTNLLDSLEAISKMNPKAQPEWKFAKDVLSALADVLGTSYTHVHEWVMMRGHQPGVGVYITMRQWSDLLLLTTIDKNPILRAAYKKALKQVKKSRHPVKGK